LAVGKGEFIFNKLEHISEKQQILPLEYFCRPSNKKRPITKEDFHNKIILKKSQFLSIKIEKLGFRYIIF
jgi:hypothetical protein